MVVFSARHFVPEIKIGIQLASLRLPFKKALQTAARLGACAVEIDARREIQVGQLSQSGIRQIRKMLEDFNLRVSALTFQTRRVFRPVSSSFSASKVLFAAICSNLSFFSLSFFFLFA